MINIFVKTLSVMVILIAIGVIVAGFLAASKNVGSTAEAVGFFFGYEFVALGLCVFLYSILAAIYKVNNSKL